MRMACISVTNYRTIESLRIELPGYYHAFSGANDSGKSNIIRAVGHIIGHADPMAFEERPTLRWSEDFPKWAKADDGSAIQICVELEVFAETDAGVFNFLNTYLQLEPVGPTMMVSVMASVRKEKPIIEFAITVEGNTYTDDKAQEVVKRLQSAPSMHFHNSTDSPRHGYSRFYTGAISAPALQDNDTLKEVGAYVQKKMGKVLRGHQERLSQLLGRLQPKYKVGLTLPEYQFSEIPYVILLESGKASVPLDDWGSGTRNRTLVLLAIFNALATKELESKVNRVVPIVVVEEPESFLHPAAQAQFGRLLQDLSEESASKSSLRHIAL